ncbi:MAG: UDP-N-acetylmuramate--L-alanine ligase [Actinomycetota bacterium]|nr:UDP-N-acetylmuramate--L-alanine ligase [Actinomycetota bacterium]
MTEDLGRVHLIGIGGAGMSGIARILLARGVPVSGSDAKESRALPVLRTLGARVDVGHRGEQVAHADTVVVSSAIRESNPELAEARRLGLPVLPRAAALAAVMAGRRGVAVAGTHGKTTTTSMLTVALQHCGADPSFAIGGDLNEAGSNAHHGTGELFVAEADESDGSFLLLSPYAAVVTNVEADHLDYYADLAAVERAFEEFLARVDPAGFVVLCADDPGTRRLAQVARASGLVAHTYGQAPEAELRVESLAFAGIGLSFEAVHRGLRLGPVGLAVPGAHNALNAAAALSAGLALGLPAATLREGLASYRGVRRRFEPKGEQNGIRVFDSYAHHHTEIAADLRAARQVARGGRVVVVFQPHRYSRTAAFATELGHSLGLADVVVVMEVYAAGEDPVPGATGAAVAAAVPLPAEQTIFEPSWSAVADRVAGLARPGDLVITLGAGDVTMLGPEVLLSLAARAGLGDS